MTELSGVTPPARRLQAARWRDPRLWVGLLLVAGSVLVGARLLAASDDTVGVWAVGRDVAGGTGLTEDMLVVQEVRFADAEAATRYLLSSESLPDRAVAGHALAAGELLPRAAVVAGDEGPQVQLPVVVGAAGAPEDLRAGELVDVWVVPNSAGVGARSQSARLLFEQARVAAATRDAGPLGDAATRHILLGLDEPAADQLATVLAELTSGTVVLIRRQG